LVLLKCLAVSHFSHCIHHLLGFAFHLAMSITFCLFAPVSLADSIHHSLKRTITYATSRPNTRTTQLFINLKENKHLNDKGFAPFTRIVWGLELIDHIQHKYQEQPAQGQIKQQGNKYHQENFPDLSYIGAARIL
jgi:Cyclophilin type peptidyl-prolyl cis-trans isomerase/CLD